MHLDLITVLVGLDIRRVILYWVELNFRFLIEFLFMDLNSNPLSRLIVPNQSLLNSYMHYTTI